MTAKETGIMGENILELTGVTKRFAGVRALSQVDLELKAGEILALLGENGAGKSTLVKVLGGVTNPKKAGSCLKDAESVFPSRVKLRS